MKRTKLIGLAGAAGLAASLVLVGPSGAAAPAPSALKSSDGLAAMALSGHHVQRVIRFEVDKPGAAKVISRISGLEGDTKLIGLDYRVQDGKLYGVGDSGGVYTIRPYTGTVQKVSQLSVALEGSSFGVDFNPAADRLRIVSDTGQNLRHDVNPAGITTVDIGLSYPPAVPPALGITAAAYTNNDLSTTTATSLFDIDTVLDQVALQAPANSGQLSATGFTGLDAGADAGFDIYSSLDRSGTTTSVDGYATLTVDGATKAYSVNLLTGDVDAEGTFKSWQRVVDLALPLNQR